MASPPIATAPDAIGIHAFTITPSNSTTLGFATRWLWISGTGNVAVTMADGSTATFLAVPSAYKLPISVTQVRATGTTATGIIGMY
jgi:hypothetical protein